MYAQHEALARAQSLERQSLQQQSLERQGPGRLGQAHAAQHRYDLELARRLARKAAEKAEKAERAGLRLRLGLARRL